MSLGAIVGHSAPELRVLTGVLDQWSLPVLRFGSCSLEFHVCEGMAAAVGLAAELFTYTYMGHDPADVRRAFTEAPPALLCIATHDSGGGSVGRLTLPGHGRVSPTVQLLARAAGVDHTELALEGGFDPLRTIDLSSVALRPGTTLKRARISLEAALFASSVVAAHADVDWFTALCAPALLRRAVTRLGYPWKPMQRHGHDWDPLLDDEYGAGLGPVVQPTMCRTADWAHALSLRGTPHLAEAAEAFVRSGSPTLQTLAQTGEHGATASH